MTSRTSGTVNKALDILDLFLNRQDGLSATQIAAMTGINISTVVRLCATLDGRKYLRRDPRNQYFVGPHIGQLARMLRLQFNLEDAVRPLLVMLRDKTGESASYYVQDGDSRICMFREDSRHPIRHVVEEGARHSLTNGVVGHVLLAYSGAKGARYDKIRSDGFYAAVGRDRFTASVALPVLTKGGEAAGAMVVSGLADRFNDRKRQLAKKLLAQACAELGEQFPAAAA